MSGNDKKPADLLSIVASTTKPDQRAALLRQIEAEWPREVEAAAVCARLLRVRYDALKAQGFTDAQALQAALKWMWP